MAPKSKLSWDLALVRTRGVDFTDRAERLRQIDLLRLLAGLDQPTFRGAKGRLSADRRPHGECGSIFQDPNLFPWLSVVAATSCAGLVRWQ